MYYRPHPELPNWAREVIGTTKAANTDCIAKDEARLNPLRSCEDDQ